MNKQYPRYVFKCGCDISVEDFLSKYKYHKVRECDIHGEKTSHIEHLCLKCGNITTKGTARNWRRKVMCRACLGKILPKDLKTVSAKKKIDCKSYGVCMDNIAKKNGILSCDKCDEYEHNDMWRWA